MGCRSLLVKIEKNALIVLKHYNKNDVAVAATDYCYALSLM